MNIQQVKFCTSNCIWKFFFICLFSAQILIPYALLCQQNNDIAAGGVVTGRVFCSDTQAPARFAQVTLLGVPKDDLQPPSSPDDISGKDAYIKATMNALSLMITQTGLDGNYSINQVAPGDYYVFASVPGYLQPSSIVQSAVNAGVNVRKGIPGVPLVHVALLHPVNADVTLERGAIISGKVVWDDGSPVSRATVQLVTTTNTKQKLPPQFTMLSVGDGGVTVKTDDQGNFRLVGQVAGDYLLKAVLTTRTQFTMQAGVISGRGKASNVDNLLSVYFPKAFHKYDAKIITLQPQDELHGQDLILDISSLHDVRGHVSSAEDRHNINYATVRVQDIKDPDFVRSIITDSNGDFDVPMIPSGSYNITVTNASDTETTDDKSGKYFTISTITATRSYADATQVVTVSDEDIHDVNFELKNSTKN
jgi:hypothetical protein